jgi:hypothetical protein
MTKFELKFAAARKMPKNETVSYEMTLRALFVFRAAIENERLFSSEFVTALLQNLYGGIDG